MIIIGCPIYKREWILDLWFECIENQTVPLSEIGFLFEMGPDDDETHVALLKWHSNHPNVPVFDGVIRMNERHATHPPSRRTWNLEAYYKMVSLRNNLLDRVTCLEPDYYFSLDSDILLENPKTLEILCEEIDNRQPCSVSPLSFMFPKGYEFPSVMSWVHKVGGKAGRELSTYEFGKTFRADIIMAAVMMSKDVYQNVRYQWHRQGEDLGFATQSAEQGYPMYCVSSVYCPHIMHQELLDVYKEFGDPRGEGVLKACKLL